MNCRIAFVDLSLQAVTRLPGERLKIADGIGIGRDHFQNLAAFQLRQGLLGP